MLAPQDPALFAIILAGGASSRLHATSPQPTVNKPLLLLQGKRIITHVLEAANQLVPPEHIVVIGPESLPTGNIARVYEDPPQSGPYMAVHTGLQYFAHHFGRATQQQGILLLGADMPYIALGIHQLLDHQQDAATNPSVAIAKAGGRLQPLLSYLPRGVAEHLFAEPVLNAGMMRTLKTTEYRMVEVDEVATADLDTYQDAIDAGITF